MTTWCYLEANMKQDSDMNSGLRAWIQEVLQEVYKKYCSSHKITEHNKSFCFKDNQWMLLESKQKELPKKHLKYKTLISWNVWEEGEV